MVFGKIACGAWLLRLSIGLAMPMGIKNHLLKLLRQRTNHFWCRRSEKPAITTPAQTHQSPETRNLPSSLSGLTPTAASSSPLDLSATNGPAMTDPRGTPTDIKPRSIYPASIIGCAMTARGEIGFLVSSIAEGNNIFASDSDKKSSSDIFLVVTWAIVLCTILGPLAVGLIVRRVRKLQHGVEKEGRFIRGDVLGVWGVS